jgi:hypothetical protein
VRSFFFNFFLDFLDIKRGDIGGESRGYQPRKVSQAWYESAVEKSAR